MEILNLLTNCGDQSCCCLTQRSTVALVCIICLLYSYVENLMTARSTYCYELEELVDSMRRLLFTLFQVANVLSLVGVYFENATLLKIYLVYILGFVVMTLLVALIDFVLRVPIDGSRSLLPFISEVGFVFVLFLCLPLVDSYRRRIESQA